MQLEKPYSILYTTGNNDPGQIFKSGPFSSYEETMEGIRNADFDLLDQYVYILTPDHRLIMVEKEDI